MNALGFENAAVVETVKMGDNVTVNFSGEFSDEAAVRTWTGSETEVKFTTTGTDKTHRAYVSKIEVTYE